MTIIFLDLDGVLVTARANKDTRGLCRQFDPRACASFNKLCAAIGDVQIVISSTWRRVHTLEELRIFLEDAGIAIHVIDVTPKRRDGHRGREIEDWLNDKVYAEMFFVIDDDVFDIDDTFSEYRVIDVQGGWSEAGLTDNHWKDKVGVL